MKNTLLPAALIVTVLASSATAGGVDWQHTYEEALALAASEKKVVFVAVNMDGERANDRTVKEIYKDRTIVKLAEMTVNLVASNSEHTSGDKTCPRFGGVTCKEHRRIDVSVRGEVLHPDEEGYVIAPQHVWLGPDGKVLLSVPYFISAPEMEWCFVTALRTVDPEFDFKLSSKARAPRALIQGGVVDTGSVEGEGGAPPTREEAMELLDELKRGTRGAERERKIRRLALADEPEAREYVLGILRASASGRMGRGGGGSGGQDSSGERRDRRGTLLRYIGAASPPSYWEVCAEFVSAGEEILRKEAVVALEQLGAPESLKAVRSALGKERVPEIKKNLFRALGAVGGDDKGARKTLLKQAGDSRNELWRLNSIIALGALAPDEGVDEFLTTALAEAEEPDQISAALAMALTRNAAWLEVLKPKLEEEGIQERLRGVLQRAVAVLEGAELSTLVDDVTQVASDEIIRTRSFGVGHRARERRGRD